MTPDEIIDAFWLTRRRKRGRERKQDLIAENFSRLDNIQDIPESRSSEGPNRISPDIKTHCIWNGKKYG